MRDYVYIGSTPSAEDCQQVGETYDKWKARLECEVFRNQIRRQLGKEPEGARLKLKTEYHDFGSYIELVCEFDDELPESVDYAFRCESDAPEHWDVQSVIELQPAASITAGYKVS
jgi:hypothetical protein